MQSQIPMRVRASHGFLLLELLVTLLVLAVFTVIAALYQTNSTIWHANAVKHMQAVNLATSFLERAGVQPEVLKHSTSSTQGDFMLTWHSDPIRVALLPDADQVQHEPSVNLITVTVVWNDVSRTKRSITMAGSIAEGG